MSPLGRMLSNLHYVGCIEESLAGEFAALDLDNDGALYAFIARLQVTGATLLNLNRYIAQQAREIIALQQARTSFLGMLLQPKILLASGITVGALVLFVVLARQKPTIRNDFLKTAMGPGPYGDITGEIITQSESFAMPIVKPAASYAAGAVVSASGIVTGVSVRKSVTTSSAAATSLEEKIRYHGELIEIRNFISLRMPTVPFREISAGDIEHVMNAHGALRELGAGNFGVVYEGRYAGAAVAVKRLRLTTLNPTQQTEFHSEAVVHAGMRHPNIVMLLAVCLEAGHFALVMEYMTGGSLYQLLHSDVILTWRQRLDMAKQLVAGVMYLHGLRDHIIHRDLKSANVLVARPYRDAEYIELKITDFGLAKIKHAASIESTVSAAGTIAWLAPEAFTAEPALTRKSDIYSLGVVFWELASRRVPYAGLGMTTLMRKISLGQTNPIPEDTPPEFAAVIQDCWKLDPSERPHARDLMPRIEALSAGFFGGGAGAGAGGGEASAAGAVYWPRTSHC